MRWLASRNRNAGQEVPTKSLREYPRVCLLFVVVIFFFERQRQTERESMCAEERGKGKDRKNLK